MRAGKLSILTVACFAAIFFNAAKAQTNSVRILKFEVDGKKVNQDFKILLYVNDVVIEPMRVENSFIMPPEIRNFKTTSVRFLSGSYDLYFDSVYLPKFDTDWIVGVDKKPFDQEYVPPKEARKLKFLYYLQFVPKNGEETRMVVKIHK